MSGILGIGKARGPSLWEESIVASCEEALEGLH
jgi:hypothetical protein